MMPGIIQNLARVRIVGEVLLCKYKLTDGTPCGMSGSRRNQPLPFLSTKRKALELEVNGRTTSASQ